MEYFGAAFISLNLRNSKRMVIFSTGTKTHTCNYAHCTGTNTPELGLHTTHTAVYTLQAHMSDYRFSVLDCVIPQRHVSPREGRRRERGEAEAFAVKLIINAPEMFHLEAKTAGFSHS